MIAMRDVAFRYAGGTFGLGVERLDIADGEAVACIGPSGSGKSTLIQLATGILVPDRGTIELAGETIHDLSDDDRRARRAAEVGFVFQEFELLDYLSALDNVLLPYRVARGLGLTRDVRALAQELAETCGIAHVLARRPKRLSQGERQRVAICRALVTRPALVVADEPTGNLDPATAAAILDLLFEQVRERGATLLTVTHDHAVLARFDRVIDVGEFSMAGATR